MLFSTHLCLPRATSRPPAHGRPAVVGPRKFLPRLEALEERWAPAVFTVTSLLDSNAAGSGSLRRAITDSNATPGPNQINILTPGTYRLTLGGIRDDNAAGSLTILNNSVSITNQSGGAVVIDGSGLTTHNDVFQIHRTTADAFSVRITAVTIQGGGGGILVFGGSSLRLDDDVIQNNTTLENGGGILAVDSSVQLNGTTVRNNTGDQGGGIFITGRTAALQVFNSLIANNSSLHTGPGGGGICADGISDATISGSEIIGNGAAGSGGGLLSTVVGTLTISSSTFANNHADGGGGGGLNLRHAPAGVGDGTFTITNVTISGNRALFGGGIVDENTQNNLLRNDTIAFNAATQSGGGVFCLPTAGGLTFVNTIVAKNTGGSGPDLDDRSIPFSSSLMDGGHNFIGDNTGGFFSFANGTPNLHGSFVGGLIIISPFDTRLVPLDPLLEPLADNGGGVALPDGSHLLTHPTKANSGNDGVRSRGSGVGLFPFGAQGDDERGFPRPPDGPTDIGASQFQDFDVTVNASAPTGPVHAGSPATFPVTVTNVGPNPAKGVTVTVTLPAGTTVVTASNAFAVSGNKVTIAVPDLAVGADTRLTLTVVPAAPGPFTATAVVSVHDDPNPDNNTSSVSVDALPRLLFDVAVRAGAPAGTLHAGIPATFTFTVTNLGPNPSHGLTVTATLPSGTTVLAASGSFTVRGNVVTFAVPDLAVGASTALTLTVVPAAPGPFTATATATATDDTNPGNNTATASVVVLPPPTSGVGSGDVTALVRIVRLGRRGPQKQPVYRVTNVSGTPIQGPLALVAAGPRSRRKARLLNAGGRSAGRQPFVRLNVGGDNILDPGESAVARLVFAKPFTPRRLTVLAGAFA
jgi:uncharacterized repeat protein (TIGR01451 family)